MTERHTVLVDADELNNYVANVTASLIMIQSDLRSVVQDISTLGAAMGRTIDSLQEFIVYVNDTKETNE